MTTLATSARNLKRVCVPMMAVAPEQEPKGKVTVETRFGVIEFDRSATLTFPKGIPGFKEYHEFGMAKLPGAGESNLVLLQSIEPGELSFIVCCYELAAGLRNVEGDALELPSQFMENWCYDADTLRRMSGHVGSGLSGRATVSTGCGPPSMGRPSPSMMRPSRLRPT